MWRQRKLLTDQIEILSKVRFPAEPLIGSSKMELNRGLAGTSTRTVPGTNID